MRIRLSQLRQIIKEEVTKALDEHEGAEPPMPLSASSWFSVMKRNPRDAAKMAAAWDDMTAAVQGDSGLNVMDTAKEMAAATGLDQGMLSFHLRKLVRDAQSGAALPSGDDLAAEVEEHQAAAKARGPQPSVVGTGSWGGIGPRPGSNWTGD